jgi:hypothetical protein
MHRLACVARADALLSQFAVAQPVVLMVAAPYPKSVCGLPVITALPMTVLQQLGVLMCPPVLCALMLATHSQRTFESMRLVWSQLAAFCCGFGTQC